MFNMMHRVRRKSNATIIVMSRAQIVASASYEHTSPEWPLAYLVRQTEGADPFGSDESNSG
jgi:hypothetical protein